MLHDVGKGQTQSHSILGSKIAIKVTERLGFESHEVELTSWLIKHHLLMSDISQKRIFQKKKPYVILLILLKLQIDLGS